MIVFDKSSVKAKINKKLKKMEQHIRRPLIRKCLVYETQIFISIKHNNLFNGSIKARL